MTSAAVVLGILEVVASEGLRPPDDDGENKMPQLTPDRVRLVCYQVVHR